MVLPVFNPGVTPLTETLADGNRVLVIDGAVQNTEEIIDYACRHIDAFRINMANNYPGPEHDLPAAAGEAALAFLTRLDATGLLGLGRPGPHCHGRISIATQPAETLRLPQRMCHTDDKTCPAGHCPVAAVLYLFHDAALGGTGFYRYRHGADFVAAGKAWMRAGAEERALLGRQYPFLAAAPAFLTESNEFVEQLRVIPAAFNRMVVYRGDLPHVPHLQHPERLARNPRRGRLSLNFFLRCRLD